MTPRRAKRKRQSEAAPVAVLPDYGAAARKSLVAASGPLEIPAKVEFAPRAQRVH
jgi:hypothetical protein